MPVMMAPATEAHGEIAPREPGRRMVIDPVAIVEVLSPSTGQVDRWRKVADYRTLPSIQEILVAFSDERRVEVQRRTADGWRVEDLIGRAEIRLGCCDAPIPLDAVYRDLLPGVSDLAPDTPAP
jgi:Uma2 family endonuclease